MFFSYFSMKTYVVGTQRDGSFEYSQHMLKLMGKKYFFTILRLKNDIRIYFHIYNILELYMRKQVKIFKLSSFRRHTENSPFK